MSNGVYYVYQPEQETHRTNPLPKMTLYFRSALHGYVRKMRTFFDLNNTGSVERCHVEMESFPLYHLVERASLSSSAVGNRLGNGITRC